MADKEIAMLPQVDSINDETKLPVYNPNALNPAQHATGAQLAAFAREGGAAAMETVGKQYVEQMKGHETAAANSAAVAAQSAQMAEEQAGKLEEFPAVKFTKQTLSTKEKAQARANIGAVEAVMQSASYTGNHINFDGAGETVSVEIAAKGAETVNLWHSGKNLLPKLTGVTDAGLTITVEDDGTIDINGTLSAGTGDTWSGTVVSVPIPNLPFFADTTNDVGYWLSAWYEKKFPNTSGDVIFRVRNQNNQNICTSNLNASNTESGTGVVYNRHIKSYEDATETLVAMDLYFYNVPNGTVFNHARYKVQLERGVAASLEYAAPSLTMDTLTVTDGVATKGITARDGINYLVTNGTSMVARVENGDFGIDGKSILDKSIQREKLDEAILQTIDSSVLCTEQTLTEAQKAQARANIGAEAVSEANGFVEYIGNHLTIHNANKAEKVCAIEVESSAPSVNLWTAGKNLLPKMTGTTAGGVTITIEDDGTIDINGTFSVGTGSAGSVVAMTSTMNLPFSADGVTAAYFISLWYEKQFPNTSGFVMFRIQNQSGQNTMTQSLNATITEAGAGVVSGQHVSSYTNESLAYIQIYFYNIPNGTVFNHVRCKVQLERGTAASLEYAPPSLKQTTLTVKDGVATASYNAQQGENYFVTDGDSMTIKTAAPAVPNQSWLGKRWACFGDSITYKSPEAIAANAKRYFDYVSADLGLTVLNYGRATTGYANSGNVSDGQYYKRMANISPGSFDVMTIMGSTNDVGPMARGEIKLGTYTDTGTATVCGCINTTIDKFYELAPFKRLGIMTMLPTYAYGPNLINTTVAENYVNELIKICKNRGIPCLDLYHGSGLRSWDQATREKFFSDGDGVHPNDEGAAFIAPLIREFVKALI